MILISAADLPFLRFVKRHQLASHCLRRICERGELSELEQGTKQQVAIDIATTDKDLVQLEQLNSWWEKAEYQGISTRLLQQLRKPLPLIDEATFWA